MFVIPNLQEGSVTIPVKQGHHGKVLKYYLPSLFSCPLTAYFLPSFVVWFSLCSSQRWIEKERHIEREEHQKGVREREGEGEGERERRRGGERVRERE